MGKTNSSGFEMNGFMREAFENLEGLFFGNVSILCKDLRKLLFPISIQ